MPRKFTQPEKKRQIKIKQTKMGLERIGEKKIVPFKFEELEREEKKVLAEIKEIFKKNADLNAELLPEDRLDLSDHQKRYLNGQLRSCGEETKETLGDVRKEEGRCHYYKRAA